MSPSWLRCFWSRLATKLAAREKISEILAQKRGGIRGRELKQYLKEQAPIWTIETSGSVGDALAKILCHRIGALIVTEPSHAIAGIVTDRDLLKFMHKTANARYPLTTTPVTRIMTTSENVVAIAPSDTRQRAVDIMKARGIRHLPVVVGDDDAPRRLVGIVSVADLLETASPSTQTSNDIELMKAELHPAGLMFIDSAGQKRSPEMRRVVTKWTR